MVLLKIGMPVKEMQEVNVPRTDVAKGYNEVVKER